LSQAAFNWPVAVQQGSGGSLILAGGGLGNLSHKPQAIASGGCGWKTSCAARRGKGDLPLRMRAEPQTLRTSNRVWRSIQAIRC